MSVWILGGSSGLGKALAEETVKRELTPIIIGRSGQMQVDLSDPKSTSSLCQRIEEGDPLLALTAQFFIWNAGELEYQPLDAMKNFDRMQAVNITSPTRILQSFVKRKKELSSPFHLIVVSSVASWKARADMSAYAGMKAYQAQFARCLAIELERDLPGSKVTIACPAGMKTGLFPDDIDTSAFMEPRAVADLIWSEAAAQQGQCDWFNVLRENGKPVVSRENFSPELAKDALSRHNRPSS